MIFTAKHIQQKLSELSGFQCDLVINENRSHVLSILDRGKNWARISMHRMFLEAPENVLNALAQYIIELDKSAFSVVRSFIRENMQRFDYSDRLKNLEVEGKFYDLQKIYNDLNKQYFNNEVSLKLTWLNRIPKRSASRIVYGQYFQALRLIKVNRLLDDPHFPDFFVSFVVYHEMLHHVVPTYIDDKGLARIHNKEFKKREKSFQYYAQAKEWEQEFRHQFFLPKD